MVFDVALVVGLNVIVVPCVVAVVVVPFVVVVVEIPLFVACGTMYVTIVVEVSIEVVGAQVFFATIVVDVNFFRQGVFGIPSVV